jgi:hypothetical protein
MRPRYPEVSKTPKGTMPKEFCATTKYSQKGAAQPLRRGPPQPEEAKRGCRPCHCSRLVVVSLAQVWQANGHP